MNQEYIDECKIIRQNCTYTAQTHHLMARSMRRQALWFQLVPAGIAAATSAGTAFGIGWPELFPWLTLAASITTAVATVLNPNRSYQEHLEAAKSFTALKHDARFLADAELSRLSLDAFVERVRNLHDKYNALVQSVPATDEKYFNMAREIVQAGIHEPDKKGGKVS